MANELSMSQHISDVTMLCKSLERRKTVSSFRFWWRRKWNFSSRCRQSKRGLVMLRTKYRALLKCIRLAFRYEAFHFIKEARRREEITEWGIIPDGKSSRPRRGINSGRWVESIRHTRWANEKLSDCRVFIWISYLRRNRTIYHCIHNSFILSSQLPSQTTLLLSPW